MTDTSSDLDHLEALWLFCVRRWRRLLLASAGAVLFLPYGCGLATGVLIGKLT